MVFLCLKLKAVAAYLHVEKIKQMEGRQAQYTRSLKPPCHGDEPTRSWWWRWKWRRRTEGLSTLLGTLRLLGQTTMLSRFLRSQREKISVLHVECSWGAIWANVDRRNASMDLCSSCPRGLKTWRRRGVFDRTSWRAQSHSALSGRTGCWRLFVYNRSGSTNWRRR